jgi:hypothetical protein
VKGRQKEVKAGPGEGVLDPQFFTRMKKGSLTMMEQHVGAEDEPAIFSPGITE